MKIGSLLRKYSLEVTFFIYFSSPPYTSANFQGISWHQHTYNSPIQTFKFIYRSDLKRKLLHTKNPTLYRYLILSMSTYSQDEISVFCSIMIFLYEPRL